MRRPSRDALAARANVGCWDAEFVRLCPTIAEYLSTTKWEDGKARVASTLTLSVGGDGMQLALNDKDLGQSLYCVAGTIKEALELLDEALREGTGAWRAWKTGVATKK